jgi:hypothetical protein
MRREGDAVFTCGLWNMMMAGSDDGRHDDGRLLVAPYPLEKVETDGDGRALLEAALPLTPYSQWLTSVMTALQALLFFVRFENMPRYLAEAVALAEQVGLSSSLY